MNNGVVDHIAYATVNTDNTLKILSIIGFNNVIYYKQKIEKFNSYITKVQSDTGALIELVEPCSEKTVVSNILQRCDTALYHSAFLSDDLKSTVNQLVAAGAVVVTEAMPIPYPATAAHQHYLTSHLYHPHLGLFEITGMLV